MNRPGMTQDIDVTAPAETLPVPPPIDPDRSALFLDLDGTLAAICPTPEEVAIERDMLEALNAANETLSGRVAVVSGRSVASLDALLQGHRFCLAGVHGLERRAANGINVRAATSTGLPSARTRLLEVAEREPMLRVEDKGLGIALHYRAAPHLEEFARREAAGIAQAHGLAMQTGKMVVEVRERGSDKGGALRAFMEEPPFLGSQPVFVGDDDTDEAGFAAAESLRGYGILVGPTRPTAARFALPDVDAVRDWLRTARADA
jgi:trehalose 6-phosphate phosphatase